MRKALTNTRVTVKLRKSEYEDVWYLYIEAYPVYRIGKKEPQRLREHLNRSIPTPIWDKKRTNRPLADGEKRFKVKRDQNGIIQCKSQID